MEEKTGRSGRKWSDDMKARGVVSVGLFREKLPGKKGLRFNNQDNVPPHKP